MQGAETRRILSALDSRNRLPSYYFVKYFLATRRIFLQDGTSWSGTADFGNAAAYAGRLYDHLSRHFGPGSVFRDIDAIRSGEDFRKAIESALNACDVALVVIGNTWECRKCQVLRDGPARPSDR
jgi:hypothetical protein